MDVASTLRQRLAPLAPAHLELHDDGADHVGHVGAASGAGHFSLVIVSEQFSGKSHLDRHRAIMARVGDLIPHPLHALAIKAYAPEEFIPS